MSLDDELEKIKRRMMRELMEPKPKPRGPFLDGVVVELEDAGFQSALDAADKPVLVDFWAEWCAPCRMMAPILEDLAKEYAGRAYFAKLNVDRNPLTARRMGVSSIPQFIVFRGGRPSGRLVGAVGKQRLAQLLSP